MAKNLTPQVFNRLPTCDQYAILEDEGVYLSVSRTEGPYQIALFSLLNFHTEVWLHMETDELFKAHAFSSYTDLDPFLIAIDLTSIYLLLHAR
jgi:hypothetical protein